jgi:4-hydroxy-3-polyprenylbenzoate decarboxylase
MTRCLTVDLEVPAEAEFVLEGYVNPDERRVEGPFGDHTGYYSLTDEYPVFHVTAITHRRSPIYATTVVGRPPMEDCYLARATERIFLPLLNTLLPEVRDFWMPWEGVFHNLTVVAIAKEYPGHARRVMSALWGQGQMSFCKMLAVVDAGTDFRRPRQVLEMLLDTVDLESDLYITEGILDVLDHSAPDPLFGGKLGIDATRRAPGERPRGTPSSEFPGADPKAIAGALGDVSPHLRQFYVPNLSAGRPLLISLKKDGSISGRSLAGPLLRHPALSAFSIIVIYDEAMDLRDASLVLWKFFNNVDPKRDMVREKNRTVIDATRKGPEDGHYRPWPDDIVMPPEVVERVKRRGKELGIEAFL